MGQPLPISGPAPPVITQGPSLKQDRKSRFEDQLSVNQPHGNNSIRKPAEIPNRQMEPSGTEFPFMSSRGQHSSDHDQPVNIYSTTPKKIDEEQETQPENRDSRVLAIFGYCQI